MNTRRLAVDLPAGPRAGAQTVAGWMANQILEVIKYGKTSLKGRVANWARLWSRRLLIVLMEDAEKLCPHNSSVIALTLRVETPWPYISASAATKARSER
jgi:hypothetical protein